MRMFPALVLLVTLAVPARSALAVEPAADLGKLLAEERSLKRELVALSMVGFQQCWPAYVLPYVWSVLPEGVSLEKVTFSGHRVTLGGIASSTQHLLEVLPRLGSDALLEVDLRSIGQVAGSFGFQIVLTPLFQQKPNDGGSAPDQPPHQSEGEIQALHDNVARLRQRRAAVFEGIVNREVTGEAEMLITESMVKAGLILKTSSRGSIRPGRHFAQLPISVIAEGTPGKVETFLSDVTKLPFLLAINEMVLEADPNDVRFLAIQLGMGLVVTPGGGSEEKLPGGESRDLTLEELDTTLQKMRQILAERGKTTE